VIKSILWITEENPHADLLFAENDPGPIKDGYFLERSSDKKRSQAFTSEKDAFLAIQNNTVVWQ
jgi:hypothetical protein